MFSVSMTIGNGAYSGAPICVDREMDQDTYDEMYDNTFYSGDELEDMESEDEDSYAVW